MSDSNPSLYRAPSTNEPYSNVSGDFNLIHMNHYFVAFPSLPGTITHSTFTSAATRRYVDTVVAKGVPDRVFYVSYVSDNGLWTHLYPQLDVNFVGMVLPGDELTVKIKHTAMRDGNFVVGVTTINQCGEKVLKSTAEVAQPTTVYTFTGQGR
jgi:fatty acid synthase subunit alpha, fungi type